MRPMTPSAVRMVPTAPVRPAGEVARRASGFTLIELLISVGTIIFLAGLTISAVSAASRRLDVQSTENTVRLLDAAMREWETATGRALTWGLKDDPYPGADYEVHAYPQTPFDFVMTEVIERIAGVPAVDDILAQIDADAFFVYEAGSYPPWLGTPGEQLALDERFDGARTVLDAWGMPIYPTHPGPALSAGRDCPYPGERDDDGTCRTYNERVFGPARHRRMNFVSAGPDRRFGDVSRPRASAEYGRSLDNVLAYEIDR